MMRVRAKLSALCALAMLASDCLRLSNAASLSESATTEIPMIYADDNPYNLAPRSGVDPEFDCAWRRAAYAYGKTLQPRMTAAHQKQLSDALALAACPGGAPEPDLGATTEEERTTFEIPAGSKAIFVDPADGADSLHAALEQSRAEEGPVTLALLPGVHRITEPLLLTPKDNNLTIQSFGDGETVLSGAKLLSAAGLAWERHKVANGSAVWTVEPGMNAVYAATATPGGPVSIHGKTDTAALCEAACKATANCNVFTWHEPSVAGYANQCWLRTDGACCGTPEAGHISGYLKQNSSNVWKTQIPASMGIDSIAGLRLNSARGQRARFPNANSETDLFPKGWVGGNGAGSLKWAPVMHGPAPDQNIQVSSPNRSFCMSEFEFYEEGKGGCCAGFTPAEGYWCSDKTSGGGAFTYRIPSGITIGSQLLPNSPYKDAKGAVFQAWRPGHWASWMFAVDSHATVTFPNTSETGATQLGWHIGGFQGARGSDQVRSPKLTVAFSQ